MKQFITLLASRAAWRFGELEKGWAAAPLSLLLLVMMFLSACLLCANIGSEIFPRKNTIPKKAATEIMNSFEVFKQFLFHKAPKNANEWK